MTCRKRDKFEIPYAFLKELASEKKIKAFALWVMLKGSYSNTIFYNYSVSSVSNTTGLSPYMLSKYVPLIVDYGWARMSDGHLVLTGFNKMFRRSRHSCVIDNTYSMSLTVKSIQLALLEKQYTNQKFVIDLHSGRIKTKKASSLKKLMEKYPCRGDERIMTSYRSLSKLFGCAISSAYKSIRMFSDCGLVSFRTCEEVVATDIRYWFKGKNTDIGYLYKKNSSLVRVCGSEFTMHTQN